MKKLNLLFTALLLLCGVGTATAHDFEVGGIYYNISSSAKKTVEVTCGDEYSDEYFNEYTGSVVIPESVTYNGTTYSVTSIGNYAFYSCSGLTSVVIPNSVTSIGVHAFTHCRGLTSVVIGDGVTSIDYAAFYCCSGLTSIEIPNSVTNIENGAFSGCDGHTSIRVAAGNTKYDSRDNCNAIIETATNTLVAGFKKTSIPNSVTSIGDNAFQDCDGLTSIEIPNSVTSIGKYAFYGCSGLTSVVIPNSVTSIGNSAFYHCDDLTSVVIPNSVTSIGDAAFRDCSGLTSIEIPNSVTSIGDAAFSDCSGLTSVVVAEDNPVYDSRNNSNAIIEIATNTLIAGCKNTTIPNSVTSIGGYAFKGCDSLTSIEIPNSVTSIGENAFNGCTGLTSIEIPNSVTSIGRNAFSDCRGLTSIEIPNSVTNIGDYAFRGCRGLTSVTIGSGVREIYSEAFAICDNLADVYCLATSVPSTDARTFNESYLEYMTLHVPAEAINSYKTTAPWSSFGTIVTFDGDVAETPKCANPVIKYNNGKIEIDCETADAEFMTTVTNSYTGNYYSNNFELSATYNIAVYAMATGYENSETVNATLCWIECECDGSDDTGVINIPATAALVTSNNGVLSISCQLNGEVVAVYTTAGTLIGTTTIDNGVATIATGLSNGTVAIVKIADKSIKVIID